MMMFKKDKQKYFSFPTMKANVNLDRLMYVYDVKKWKQNAFRCLEY